MSGRTTPRRNRTALVRAMDLEIVARARVAVAKAMEVEHERNPARYHQDRPSITECPFDPSCPFTSDTGG